MLSPEEQQAIRILQSGGVIACATDTVWALACLPDNKAAVQKIYDIKKREAAKPLILMSNTLTKLQSFAEWTPRAHAIAARFWPGALTLVLPKTPQTPDYIAAGGQTIGLRVPNHAGFQRLCQALPTGVLATTSANLSHQPAALSYAEVCALPIDADFILPDMTPCSGTASTVCLLTENKVSILRQGAVRLSFSDDQ